MKLSLEEFDEILRKPLGGMTDNASMFARLAEFTYNLYVENKKLEEKLAKLDEFVMAIALTRK